MGYSDERNVQILLSVMKENNIRKVVVSPGTTNMCFVGSIQEDPFFEKYSAADERSAAYIACGLAAESGECVAINCTGATASRNYYPAMTEAFYRKLPILVITSSRRNSNIGHHIDQVTDRTLLAKDVAKMSVQMPVVHDTDDEWASMIAANKAVLELRHRGGGPVHINLETTYSGNFTVEKLPETRIIKRFTIGEELPKITDGKIAIMVGSHFAWNDELTNAVETFCELHNAVVLSDHIGNYRGKYRVSPYLISQQANYRSVVRDVDLLIHIGDITSSEYRINAKEVWRVDPDGEIRDTYRMLKAVFEMTEEQFFKQFAYGEKKENLFFKTCEEESSRFRAMIPEMPFSNAWCAQKMSGRIPENAVVHFAIRNSLRVWSFFDLPDSVLCYANTGGFGIDGCLSSVIGAALASRDKVFFCIIGDLAFFYDMNALGNRHMPSNVRILLVNNGAGMEMKFYSSPASAAGCGAVNEYLSAMGHYGQRSHNLVKDYVTDLGFAYYSAHSKEEVENQMEVFLSPNPMDRPMVFEVFTACEDEDTAFKTIRNVMPASAEKATVKSVVKGILGENGVKTLKKYTRFK